MQRSLPRGQYTEINAQGSIHRGECSFTRKTSPHLHSSFSVAHTCKARIPILLRLFTPFCGIPLVKLGTIPRDQCSGVTTGSISKDKYSGSLCRNLYPGVKLLPRGKWDQYSGVNNQDSMLRSRKPCVQVANALTVNLQYF